MDAVLNRISESVGGYVPNLVGALAILVLGWLVARIIAAVVRGALRRTNLDNRLANWLVGETVPVEQGISTAVFYLLMVFVLVAFFQVLGLTLPTEPLNRLLSQIFQFAPQVLGACLLLLIAWIVASVLRMILLRSLGAIRLDERLTSQVGIEGEKASSLTRTLADTVYWLVLLLFLPAVLNALALQGLLAPVQGMVNKILDFLPNIFTAGLILLIGWLLARIVQRVLSNLLAVVGADQLSERVGLAPVLGRQRLSGVLGLVAYVLILIPVLIAALEALALEAITGPASNMLNTILSALPAIFAALLIVVVAYAVGRVVASLTTNLLAGVGFNTVLARLGLGREPAAGERTPAEIVGYLVFVGIMLFATIEAVRELGFVLLADLMMRFTVFVGEVVLGLIIFGIGLYLANLASSTVRASGANQAALLALAARVSIIVLAGAMALRQMGLAEDIVNMAFGLLLGSVAVAIALAFGLGAREIAGREVAEWVQSIKSKQ
ncbi:MAG TPA: mechanosensitive ion channel [Candidatus Binatia bacterium]|nr:mechanosensitive ion channel [Candidatus Binatia bacterium]